MSIKTMMQEQEKMLHRGYFDVQQKLIISLIISLIWVCFSIWVGLPWLIDLSSIIGYIPAFLIVSGLAIIPGLANSFIVASMFFDKRPLFFEMDKYPPITIMIASYNEEDCIGDTIDSIALQDYNGPISIIVGNDGSVDDTYKIVIEKHLQYKSKSKFNVQVVSSPTNIGKGNILNQILRHVKTEFCITIDADTYLYKNSLKRLVENIVDGPPNTGAVAGTVLVRNSRKNFMTKIQDWDYFHGIAVVKRIQSLYQGTLVAQGAFSIYNTKILKDLGGWTNTVGEDIVLTWGIRKGGHRVSYAEEAIAFTNVPDNYKQFFNQRKRWARGLIEAFKKYPDVIWQKNMSLPFVWLNLTFPFNDFIFMFAFVPGIIAAIFFQYYAIVGIMTITLLPMALLMNWYIFKRHCLVFEKLGLMVRRNILGFAMYVLLYQIIMTPASLCGYFAEFFNLKKTWGTKNESN